MRISTIGVRQRVEQKPRLSNVSDYSVQQVATTSTVLYGVMVLLLLLYLHSNNK